MQAFRLKISGSDVSTLVDVSTLTEYTQTLEGDGLWDYRLDDLSVSLDKEFIDDLDIKPTEVYRLRKLNVQLLYYEVTVFQGVIEGVKYDYKTETVDLDISSWGKIIKDLPVSLIETSDTVFSFLLSWNDNLYTWKKQKGDSPLAIAKKLTDRTRRRRNFLSPWIDVPGSIEEGLISGSYSNPYYTIDMDVDDFPAYKTLEADKPPIDDMVVGTILENYAFSGIRKCTDENITSNYGKYFGVWRGNTGEGSIGSPTHGHYILELKKDGFVEPSRAQKISNDLTLLFSYKIAKDVVEKCIYTQLENSQDWLLDITYQGAANFNGEIYWIYANDTLFKLSYKDEDLFWYKYENKKVGTIQKDIAILTNSLTWVWNNKIYFRKRDPSQTISNKQILDCSCEMIIKNDELPLSDGIRNEIPEFVLSEMNEWYNEYMDGTFLKYSILIDRNEFVSSDYPLIAKNLEIILEDKKTNVGIIKEVTYKEDVIEITTEIEE